MSEVEYSINHNLDGWPICKNGEPIFDNKTMLAELHSFQARIKELEAAHTAALKTYTACSNERERLRAENAELVEALEKIDAMPHYDYPLRFGCNKSLHDRYELMLQTASEALAAYRKQGGEQQLECGCCGQTGRCDDDCDAVVIGGHRAAEHQLDGAQLVEALRMLVAFGDQLNDNAIECVFDDSTVEVSSVVYWREFRLALEEADHALAAYRKGGAQP